MNTINLTQLAYVLKDNPQYESLKNSEDISFMGACIQNVNLTHAQNFQDIWVLHETNFAKNLFYVEFGATNGDSLSNTFLLDKKYNWNGILGEPNTGCHEELERNRPNAKICKKCVYDVSGEMLEFIVPAEADLATIKGFGEDDEHATKRKTGREFYVESITLYDMLKEYDAPNTIDYLSIDTEGSEYNILKKFFETPDNPYNIRFITVEHNFSGDNRQKIYDLLTKNGYHRKFTEMSRWDDFYVRGNV